MSHKNQIIILMCPPDLLYWKMLPCDLPPWLLEQFKCYVIPVLFTFR